MGDASFLVFAALTSSFMCFGWSWANKLGEPGEMTGRALSACGVFYLSYKTVTSSQSRPVWMQLSSRSTSMGVGWEVSPFVCTCRLCSWGMGVSTGLPPKFRRNLSYLSLAMIMLKVALPSGNRGWYLEMVIPIFYRSNICIEETHTQIYFIISLFNDKYFLTASTLNRTGSPSNKIPLKLFFLFNYNFLLEKYMAGVTHCLSK